MPVSKGAAFFPLGIIEIKVSSTAGSRPKLPTTAARRVPTVRVPPAPERMETRLLIAGWKLMA